MKTRIGILLLCVVGPAVGFADGGRQDVAKPKPKAARFENFIVDHPLEQRLEPIPPGVAEQIKKAMAEMPPQQQQQQPMQQQFPQQQGPQGPMNNKERMEQFQGQGPRGGHVGQQPAVVGRPMITSTPQVQTDPMEGISEASRTAIRESSTEYNKLFPGPNGQSDMYDFLNFAQATAECFKRDKEVGKPMRQYDKERKSLVESPEVTAQLAKEKPPKDPNARTDYYLQLLGSDRYHVREWAQGELGKMGMKAKNRLMAHLIAWYDKAVQFQQGGKPVPKDGGVKITTLVWENEQRQRAAHDIKQGFDQMLRGLFQKAAPPPPDVPTIIDPVFGDITHRGSLKMFIDGGRYPGWVRDSLPMVAALKGGEFMNDVEKDLATLAQKAGCRNALGLCDLENRVRALSFLRTESNPGELLAGCLNNASEAFAQGFGRAMLPAKTLSYCVAAPQVYGGGYGYGQAGAVGWGGGAGGWQAQHDRAGRFGGFHGRRGYAMPQPPSVGESLNEMLGGMPLQTEPNVPNRMEIEKSMKAMFQGAVACSKDLSTKVGENPPLTDVGQADSSRYAECMRRALTKFSEPLHAAAYPNDAMPMCDRQPARNYPPVIQTTGEVFGF